VSSPDHTIITCAIPPNQHSILPQSLTPSFLKLPIATACSTKCSTQSRPLCSPILFDPRQSKPPPPMIPPTPPPHSMAFCYIVGDNIDTGQIIPAEPLNLAPSHPEEYRKLGPYALTGLPSSYPLCFVEDNEF